MKGFALSLLFGVVIGAVVFGGEDDAPAPTIIRVPDTHVVTKRVEVPVQIPSDCMAALDGFADAQKYVDTVYGEAGVFKYNLGQAQVAANTRDEMKLTDLEVESLRQQRVLNEAWEHLSDMTKAVTEIKEECPHG